MNLLIPNETPQQHMGSHRQMVCILGVFHPHLWLQDAPGCTLWGGGVAVVKPLISSSMPVPPQYLSDWPFADAHRGWTGNERKLSE